MDWVEERARTESLIREAAPDLWNDLCSAFEEAVKSMQRLYENVSQLVLEPLFFGESGSG
jgi:hypothetical protein